MKTVLIIFYVGNSVRAAELAYTYYQAETAVFEQLKEAAAPADCFDIFTCREKDGKRVLAKKPVSTKTTNLKNIILTNLPKGVEYSGDKGYKLSDVKSGRVSMDAFVAQLDTDELEAISRGHMLWVIPLVLRATPVCSAVFLRHCLKGHSCCYYN